MFGLAGLALTVAVAGEPALGSSEPRVSWLRITLGTAAIRYREQLGDPLRVTPVGTDPPVRNARYLLTRAPRTYLVVTERRGEVVGIGAISEATPTAPITSVPADPSGVVLGSTEGEVAKARPAARRWLDPTGSPHLEETIDAARGIVADYRFDGGRLRADTWLLRQGAEVPQLPGAIPLAEASGESELSAILDAQTTERDGVDWEYLYLRLHPCDATTAWHLNQQVLTKDHGRAYDVLFVTCPTTGAKRAFFFDITPYLGK